MSNKVNISASGQLAIGNIVQGDKNRANAAVSTTLVDQVFDNTSSALNRLAAELKKPAAELDAVLGKLKELRDESKLSDAPVAKGGAILDTIRENFSWAYPVVKDFVSVAWPTLLAALGL